jgi:hypothetical protein
MSPRSSLLPLALLLATVPLLLEDARGCAPVPRKGELVEITDESAVIIWDAASKTQHFIRRASFKTLSSDFGFLVPTPAEPQLAEASDQAFTYLEAVTAPKVVNHVIKRPPPAGLEDQAAAKAEPVRVLQEKRVAGFDAAVLEADDPKALAAWLEKNGYPSSPTLTAWLAPYVAKHWKVTAFKIARDAKDAQGPPGVATNAVRMTFKADRPFFPYREPTDQRAAAGAGPRLLRVYLLADKRMAGTLGENGNWPGRVAWAGQLDADQRKNLLGMLQLPPGTPPGSWWLTEFEDRSSPRPGTDEVYFDPAAEQAAVARPPVVHYVYAEEGDGQNVAVPVDVDAGSLALLYALGGFFLIVILAVALWLLLTRTRKLPEV